MSEEEGNIPVKISAGVRPTAGVFGYGRNIRRSHAGSVQDEPVR